MFAPNSTTYQVADSIHQERLDHAALLHKLSQDREESPGTDREAQRRLTSRRLAATAVAAALTFAIAAAAAAAPAAAPAERHSPGGGMTLIR